MNPQLEALLKACVAFLQARRDEDAVELFALYESRLQDLAAGSNIEKDALHRAVKIQYSRWLRASSHPPTLPPRA